MITRKRVKLEIWTNLLQYRPPQKFIFTDKILMHQTIKHSTLTKAKHCYMLTLNPLSHLDAHALHIELCCSVGNKTHLHIQAHIIASPPAFLPLLPPQWYCYFQLQWTYQSIALPINRKSRNQLPELKKPEDFRTVSNLKDLWAAFVSDINGFSLNAIWFRQLNFAVIIQIKLK